METPRRIFASYPDSPLCFCDYAFPDEKLFESRERFRDLLELHVKEEQLDTASESQPCTYKTCGSDSARADVRKKNVLQNVI